MKYAKIAFVFVIVIQFIHSNSDKYAKNVKLMFDEINQLRTNPKSQIPYIKKGISEFNGNVRKGITSNEGPSAWKELAQVLGRQKPLKPMTWSNGLAKACQKFVNWAGPRGSTGHYGPNGKSMSNRIEAEGDWIRNLGENLAYGTLSGKESQVQLQVDDGVPSRGHRKNQLSSKFGAVGIAIHTHRGYRYMTCQDFAGGFKGAQEANPTYIWQQKASSTSGTGKGSTSGTGKGSTSGTGKGSNNNSSTSFTDIWGNAELSGYNIRYFAQTTIILNLAIIVGMA